MKKLSKAEADQVRLHPPTNLNMAEASAYVGISERKLREEVIAKRLRCANVGRRCIFQKIELDRYLSMLSEGVS